MHSFYLNSGQSVLFGLCMPVGASDIEPRLLFNFGKDVDGNRKESVAADSLDALRASDEANFYMDSNK